MQIRSEAIILRTVKYGDSSMVLTVFGPECGLLSLISNVSRNSKKGLRKPLMQVLSLVEIIYSDKSKGELKRLQELRILHPYQEIPFDPVKSCLALFLAELLSKSLKEEATAPQLYQFLKEAFIYLDEEQASLANFLPSFLMDFSAYLGFEPHFKENSQAPYYDLLDAEEIFKEPLHSYYIYGNEAQVWAALQAEGYKNSAQIALTNSGQRRQVLENMLSYYRLHFNDFGQLKSLPVLYDLLH
jgi:DNA repair protein RecO (recombination protein O)